MSNMQSGFEKTHLKVLPRPANEGLGMYLNFNHLAKLSHRSEWAQWSFKFEKHVQCLQKQSSHMSHGQVAKERKCSLFSVQERAASLQSGLRCVACTSTPGLHIKLPELSVQRRQIPYFRCAAMLDGRKWTSWYSREFHTSS